MIIARILGVALVAVLIVGLAGTAFWGYQEQQDKNALLIQAENNYQRAFHELSNNVSNLEDELGKSLAMNSPRLIAPCMANIWRISYQAHNNLGQLPLYMTPFQKAESFLTEIADYTYEIGMRDMDEEPVNEEEWSNLQALHAQAQDIGQELNKLQMKVLEDDLRWMDVEMAVASQDKDMDKQIINGVEDLDKRIEGFIETEGGPLENKFGEAFEDKKQLIEGESIDEQQAREKAEEFIDEQHEQVEVVKDKDARDFHAYSVIFDRDENGNQITVDVSQKGGHVLWFLDSRDIEETEIGLHDAQNEAIEFLAERGIENMVAIQSDQYDNVGVFDFVSVQDDVRIYPDLIRCKVALDNGDIIGYEALDYVVHHDEELELPEPQISLEEAAESVNGHFELQESHLSYVELESGDMALCYELLGTVEDNTYSIFVNAETGEEEKVSKMKLAQPIV